MPGEPDAQTERDRDESLLGAVVEVALDVAPGAVGGLEDAGARRADLGELGLRDLVLAQRPLGLAAGGDVEDRAVEPPAAVARLLREPALEHPADRAVPAHEPVLERERRPVSTDSMTRVATYSWSSGCSMLWNVRTALSMKSDAG